MESIAPAPPHSCISSLGDSIAIPEFSSLLEAVHGASLSREEVVSAMKAIAPANPEVVTFEEFYKVINGFFLKFCFVYMFFSGGIRLVLLYLIQL